MSSAFFQLNYKPITLVIKTKNIFSMRIGIGQILILLIVIFLFFGDFENLKKKILKSITQFTNKKNKKKGT